MVRCNVTNGATIVTNGARDRDKWCEQPIVTNGANIKKRQKGTGVTYCDTVDKFDTMWYYCCGVIK